MVTTRVSRVKPRAAKRDMTLPVPAELRELAEQVMTAGDYGTLTNTLRVALREQLKRLSGASGSLADHPT